MAHPRTKAPALATLFYPNGGDFLLAQRGLSPNTVEAYGKDIESFFLYRQELAQGAAEESLPDPDEYCGNLLQYLCLVTQGRQNTGRTLPVGLSALRAVLALL